MAKKYLKLNFVVIESAAKCQKQNKQIKKMSCLHIIHPINFNSKQNIMKSLIIPDYVDCRGNRTKKVHCPCLFAKRKYILINNLLFRLLNMERKDVVVLVICQM